MRTSLFVLLLVLTSGVLGTAQGPSTQPPGTQTPPVTFRTEANFVEVHADRHRRVGAFVRGLTADDFEIIEDGRLQKPATVRSWWIFRSSAHRSSPPTRRRRSSRTSAPRAARSTAAFTSSCSTTCTPRHATAAVKYGAPGGSSSNTSARTTSPRSCTRAAARKPDRS